MGRKCEGMTDGQKRQKIEEMLKLAREVAARSRHHPIVITFTARDCADCIHRATCSRPEKDIAPCKRFSAIE